MSENEREVILTHTKLERRYMPIFCVESRTKKQKLFYKKILMEFVFLL